MTANVEDVVRPNCHDDDSIVAFEITRVPRSSTNGCALVAVAANMSVPPEREGRICPEPEIGPDHVAVPDGTSRQALVPASTRLRVPVKPLPSASRPPAFVIAALEDRADALGLTGG